MEACPVECIHIKANAAKLRRAPRLYVDTELCINCGACALACPESAITFSPVSSWIAPARIPAVAVRDDGTAARKSSTQKEAELLAHTAMIQPAATQVTSQIH
jgi:NAD-dependent dihydropyrimidine dehydrogenase PreA subunit